MYRKGKLYYVGLAGNLRSRLKQHLKNRHGNSWDRFSIYLTIGDSHLRELESLLLRIVRPAGNKQAGKFHRRCENLKKHFAGNVRKLHRQELDSLLGHYHESSNIKNDIAVSDGRRPSLQPYIQNSMKLRAFFKGRMVHARVKRNGTIRYKGTIYNSPSYAAAAACNRRKCNGWAFWKFERAPGDWVPLAELRR